MRQRGELCGEAAAAERKAARSPALPLSALCGMLLRDSGGLPAVFEKASTSVGQQRAGPAANGRRPWVCRAGCGPQAVQRWGSRAVVSFLYLAQRRAAGTRAPAQAQQRRRLSDMLHTEHSARAPSERAYLRGKGPGHFAHGVVQPLRQHGHGLVGLLLLLRLRLPHFGVVGLALAARGDARAERRRPCRAHKLGPHVRVICGARSAARVRAAASTRARAAAAQQPGARAVCACVRARVTHTHAAAAAVRRLARPPSSEHTDSQSPLLSSSNTRRSRCSSAMRRASARSQRSMLRCPPRAPAERRCRARSLAVSPPSSETPYVTCKWTGTPN